MVTRSPVYGTAALSGSAAFKRTFRSSRVRPTIASHTLHSAVPLGDGGSALGLAPVHSPLLRGYRLVFFPPLINMLKLSGWKRQSQVDDSNDG